MNKPLLAWLCELPPDIRDKAITNVMKQKRNLETKWPRMDSAINAIGTWRHTQEGQGYWRELHLKHGGQFTL